MKKQPAIEVYFAQICGLCHEAMGYFRSRGWSFEAHEVFWDGEKFTDTDTTRAMYRRCGGTIDFVPQIFINGHHIPGWRRMQALIASGEFERLLDAPPTQGA